MQMHDLRVSTKDDFEALPPAVQRKFFSNLERFRLLTTQHYPRHHAHAQFRRDIEHPPKRPLSIRTKTSSAVITSRQRNSRQKAFLRRRPRSAVDYDPHLVQEYWQCFDSLPPKIQKIIFSKEEQRLLHRTAPVSQITDAADQALLKFEERHRASLQRESRSRSRSRPRSGVESDLYDDESDIAPRIRRRSRVSSSPSSPIEDADPTDSGIEMEESILDSFRWLDEDEDLDLSLDSYHKYVSDTAQSNAAKDPTSTPRRMPSFRRTLSLAKNRNSLFIGNRTLSSSQSSTIPFSSTMNTYSNRSSQNFGTHSRHATRRSTSSIDPAAQYYQDPEARLKLRVYLASPQKFDEAIEFGFPSLENKENNSVAWRRDSKRISQLSASTHGWTFLDDESTSVDLSLFDYAHEHNKQQQQLQQQSQLRRKSKDLATSSVHEVLPSPSVSPDLRRPQPLKPLSSSGNNAPGHRREMTLKMTLTRPDLRTNAADLSLDDPLRLAELPPADETLNIWDDMPEDQGVVKKMWRKLRAWRD